MNAPNILWSKTVHSILGAFWDVLRCLEMSWDVLSWTQNSDCIPMSSSSYSSANGLNLRLHSHEFKFLFPANESQTASPWVPIPCQWISGCLSSSPYSPANESLDAWVQVPIPLPMNLRMHPMSPYLPAKILESFGWVPPMSYHPDSGMPIEAQKIAFWRDFGGTPIHTTWVPLKSIVERFRCLLRDFCFWLGFMRISDSSMHDVQYLCGFSKNPMIDLLLGWSPSGWGSGWDSWFRNAPRRSKNRILARFWGYPYTYHMGTPKIDCRAF